MKRTNTFAVRPLSERGEQLLRDLLDASAALWNEVNYERLMRYNDEEGFEGDVWDADTGRLEGRYKGVLGASTAQQVIRTNSEAWRGFFRLKDQYHDETTTSVTTHPEPPGFRGNEDDGRQLKTVIRNTSYTIDWGERSRLEILVGSELKDRYDHTGRLRLEIAGDPNWPDYEKQGRWTCGNDETDSTVRASQPVTVSDDLRDIPLADETAALDIGANNLVACTTTTDKQYLYEGRDLFTRFRETTREIARLQSKLEDGRYSSQRIRRLYRKRTRRRDHAQEALCRDLLERLYKDGVETVYIGGLTDVLETHWSVETNAKTHNFWAFKAIHRTTGLYRRRVRYLSRGSVGSVDESRVPAVRFDRPDDTASGHAHVYMWFRRPCRSDGVRNVLEAAHEQGSQADGTARAVRVGRPHLVGVTTLSPSQRTAHRPEYRPRGRECCLRGDSDLLRLPRPRGNSGVHAGEVVIRLYRRNSMRSAIRRSTKDLPCACWEWDTNDTFVILRTHNTIQRWRLRREIPMSYAFPKGASDDSTGTPGEVRYRGAG